MTVKELRDAIENGKLSEGIVQTEWFNRGLEYALNMVDVYAAYQEPETGPERQKIMGEVKP